MVVWVGGCFRRRDGLRGGGRRAAAGVERGCRGIPPFLNSPVEASDQSAPPPPGLFSSPQSGRLRSDRPLTPGPRLPRSRSAGRPAPTEDHGAAAGQEAIPAGEAAYRHNVRGDHLRDRAQRRRVQEQRVSLNLFLATQGVGVGGKTASTSPGTVGSGQAPALMLVWAGQEFPQLWRSGSD